MRKHYKYFFLLSLGFLTMLACSTPIQNFDSTSDNGSRVASIPISVKVSLPPSSLSSSASRGLIADSSVFSVAISVYSGTTLVGSGNLTKGTTDWNGKISVSQSGLLTFDANAENSSSQILWFGTNNFNITGSGNSVSLTLSSFAPTGLSTTAGVHQIQVSWNSVSGATSYNLYWSNSSGLTTANGTKISVTGTSYTQTGLSWTSPVYYLVTAVDSAGESAPSTIQKNTALIQWTNYTSTQGLPNYEVASIVISGSTWILGTLGGGVSVSTNSGSSWTNSTTTQGLAGNFAYGVSLTGSNLYAASSGGAGLSVSTSLGSSWSSTTASEPIISQGLAGVSASGSTIVADSVSGLAISTNSGTSWSDFSSGNFAAGATCSTFSGSTIYVGTGGFGLESTTNNGSSWTNSNGMGNAQILGVYVNSSDIYLGTSGGFSVSTNSGSSWQNFTTTQGLASNTVYGVWGSGNDLLASTTSGFCVSNDDGATWYTYTSTQGLAGNSSRVVVVSGSTIYVGTPGGLSVGS